MKNKKDEANFDEIVNAGNEPKQTTAEKSDAQTQLEVNDRAAHQNAEGKIILPVKQEQRKKQFALLLKPSTHTKLKAIAKAQGYTMNEIINYLCELYISQQTGA